MVGALCVALGILTSAIQWGWQSLPEGGREYIVQVDPQLSDLDTFRREGFSSDVPPQLRDIRRIRIVIGSDPLPNQGKIPSAPAPLPAGMSATPLNAVPHVAEPLNAGSPVDSQSTKVALADGHQPASAPSDGEPVGKNAARTAQQAKLHSPSNKPVEHSAGLATTAPPRPWLTLMFVAGGLIVSLSGNVFLGWIHWGTRNQYRALISQLRVQRNAAAVS